MPWQQLAVEDRVRARAAGPVAVELSARIRPLATCQLTPETVPTVQPGGIVPASKPSERTGGPAKAPGP